MSLLAINKKAIKVIRTIRVLEKISWPSHIEKEFFDSIQKKKKKKLTFEYQKDDYSEKIATLTSLLPHLSKENPLHIYTAKTIESYINAMVMLSSVGKKRFQEISIEEYGMPRHKLFGTDYSHLNTAENFLESFHDYDHPYVKEDVRQRGARELKEFLERETRKVLGKDSPKFTVSRQIVSKAAAGLKKIRIRHDSLFNSVDFKNLLIHEVFTHTLTAVNGRYQKELPLLGYGAPRTTKTQEGLATFSEAVTGLLDLNRLKRISLRVMAIDLALDGADIYDLYDFFKSKGQSDRESYLSSSRILRGGFPKGGIAFTKDGVYLEGLIRVHSFFRWAFKTQNLDLVHLLFIGRLDINDIFLLKESYEQGLLRAPQYLPDWYKHTNLLAGKMAFSLILNDICLKSVENHYESKFLWN